MKKIIRLFICLLLVLSLAGCFKSEKSYTVDELTITIDSGFSETEQIGIDLMLVSRKYMVAVVKTNQYSSYTLDAYCKMLKNSFTVDLTFNDSETNNGDKFKYSIYTNSADGKEYSYVSAVYKYKSNFYMVDMAVSIKNASDKVNEKFLNYAKSVTFGELVK